MITDADVLERVEIIEQAADALPELAREDLIENGSLWFNRVVTEEAVEVDIDCVAWSLRMICEAFREQL